MQSVQSVTRCCLLVLLLPALCVNPHPLGISQPLPQQLNTERGDPSGLKYCNKLCAQHTPTKVCTEKVCSKLPDVVDDRRKRTELPMAP
uniref:Ctr_153_T conopeptide n=1 Tax=Conus tribblei TaxID=101761 RepID=A0A0C9SEN3_CONTD